MLHYEMPAQLFACEVDGPHVFLDLAGDRYFRLPPAEEAAFAAIAAGHELPAHQVEPLVRAGILRATCSARPIALTSHLLPEESLPEGQQACPAASPLDIAEVLLLVASSRRTVVRKALPRALSARRQGRAQGQAVPARDGLVGRFVAARRYVPITPNCLYDSLALGRFLARRNVSADLVIGVKLHPFGAHCWLQDGTTVLNDSLGGALVHRPILVA